MTRCFSFLLTLSLLATGACDKSKKETATPAAPTPTGEAEGEPEATEAEAEAESKETGEESAGEPAEATTGGDDEERPAWMDGPRDVAMVKIEIREEDRSVTKHPVQTFDWDMEQKVTIKTDNHTHELRVVATRLGKRKVQVKFWYDLDGTQVVRAYKLEMGAKEREAMRIEGGLGLAFTVTPKTIQPPKDDREKMEKPKDKDPLSGVGDK